MSLKHPITENETLMKEWDFEKNDPLGLDPSQIGLTSHKKAWWKCEEGHSWYALISNRSEHNRGCPYCTHQLPIKGENDLQSMYPELAAQWHPRNNKRPDEYTSGSHIKVWWKCDKGHEWEAVIKNRVKGSGCPYCSGKLVIKGVNDLATKDPDLAAEWHPERNGDLKPSDVTLYSNKRVWWKCRYGHEFEATVSSRSHGAGCKKCSDSRRTSFPEQALYFYVRQLFPDAINGYKESFEKGMELDIYVPSLKTGIEFDGKVYHSNRSNQNRDLRKYEKCKELGITLLRVQEPLPISAVKTCDMCVQIIDESDQNLNFAISVICSMLGKKIVPDVRRDRKAILAYLSPKKNSFINKYPELLSEWDYEKNYPILPEFFALHSGEKVFWKCRQCGFSWEATIADRTREDAPTNCPVCSSKAGARKRIQSLIEKGGSLAEMFPSLLEEWDYEKNQGIRPEELTVGSGKKVNWKCKTCGYEWKSAVLDRTNGRGCPCCINRVIVPGKNDLAFLMPQLLKEWDYEKNKQIGLEPTGVSLRSGKKAFWKCSVCGHEWSAVIATRTKGTGCPNFRKHINFIKGIQTSLFDDET